MKRKISLLIICILFVIFGSKGTEDITILSTSLLPLDLIGKFLRNLSIHGGFRNFLAIIIYITIILLPMVLLVIIRVSNKILKIDYIFLPILSVSIGFAIYYFINPHLIFTSLNYDLQTMLSEEYSIELETILKTGIAFSLYSIFAIYLIVKTYVNRKFNNPKFIKYLI